MTEKQRQENLVVEKRYHRIMKERENCSQYDGVKVLNHCQAVIWSANGYTLLQSYYTIVAAIDDETGICYDWLRLVYGYTATSAQHIRKFVEKYGNGQIKRWKQ